MMTETVLKKTIIQHLIEKYGHVETERFISLVIKEPFDYTKWSRDLFADMTTDELLDEVESWERSDSHPMRTSETHRGRDT